MTTKPYAIVGAPLTEPTRYRQPDGTAAYDTTDCGTPADINFDDPLTVETIGKLVVELSKIPDDQRDNIDEEMITKAKDTVKWALAFVDKSDDFKIAQQREILDHTNVEFVFERRTEGADGQPDTNTRILVIPADGALEFDEQALADQGETVGFRPPLSYQTDHMLMVSWLQSGLLAQALDSFAATQADAMPEAQLAALKAHVSTYLATKLHKKSSAGGTATNDRQSAILKSPVRAFYRSVGIYSTNMCR